MKQTVLIFLFLALLTPNLHADENPGNEKQWLLCFPDGEIESLDETVHCLDLKAIPLSEGHAFFKALDQLVGLETATPVPTQVAPTTSTLPRTPYQIKQELLYSHLKEQIQREQQEQTAEQAIKPRTITQMTLRGIGIAQGLQIIGLGTLLLLPSDVTNWSDRPLAKAGDNLRYAWSHPPVWDRDSWAINYIGHPMAGALSYNSLRSQGATVLQSFIFSTGQSLFWEYVVEAIAEKPSIQDLLFTSTIGSLLGEGINQMTIQMKKNGFKTWEKVVIIIINPTYVLNRGFRP